MISAVLLTVLFLFSVSAYAENKTHGDEKNIVAVSDSDIVAVSNGDIVDGNDGDIGDGSDGNISEELAGYDFSQIDKIAEEKNINFGDMVEKLATGRSEGVFYELFKSVGSSLFGDLSYNKTAVIKIIFIAIVSSLFTNMSVILKKSELSETGFYVTYMLTVTILMGGFAVISDMVAEVVKNITSFMNVLVPAFALSLGMASGSVSAAGFSQLIIMAIAVIESIILRFAIPGAGIYVVLVLVNNIVGEDYFSKFAEVIKTFIAWALKGLIAILMGANIIQGMILPSVDGAKTGIVNKIINIIPGGSAITNAEGIITSTGSVIKNAIGGAGLIVLCAICIFPMVKMLIYIAMYRITSAVIEPISDKRLGGSVDAVAEGAELLYRTVLTVAFLFFITIAIVCLTTNIRM